MARKLAIAVLALGFLTAVFALDAGAQKKGGVLRIGIIGEPPALDVHWTTAALTANMSNHLYESLYEKVPVARYGDLHNLHAMRSHVKGYNERLEWMRFHNVWLDK